ncbi:hypothetical protein LP420_10755 [Massilia sp. B-10]|nr:hypothetical protein LP420_10755 [Massilia sp. B-10]
MLKQGRPGSADQHPPESAGASSKHHHASAARRGPQGQAGAVAGVRRAAMANTFVSRKATNAVRTHLGSLLGDGRLYNLDRLDLSVVSTLDSDAQKAVTAALRNLRRRCGGRRRP